MEQSSKYDAAAVGIATPANAARAMRTLEVQAAVLVPWVRFASRLAAMATLATIIAVWVYALDEAFFYDQASVIGAQIFFVLAYLAFAIQTWRYKRALKMAGKGPATADLDTLMRMQRRLLCLVVVYFGTTSTATAIMVLERVLRHE